MIISVISTLMNLSSDTIHFIILNDLAHAWMNGEECQNMNSQL